MSTPFVYSTILLQKAKLGEADKMTFTPHSDNANLCIMRVFPAITLWNQHGVDIYSIVAANPSEAFGEIADSMPFHLRIKDPRAAKPFQEAFQSSGELEFTLKANSKGNPCVKCGAVCGHEIILLPRLMSPLLP